MRLGAVVLLAGLLSAGRAWAAPARFALLVGSNIGDPHEPHLRHAEDDASRMAQTMRAIGDFPVDRVLLMTGATADELREALVNLNARVRQEKEAVLLVFYSGHADAVSLHLAGTRFPMSELKALLVSSPAASRVLIVDACRSGALTTIKGAHPAETFAVPPLEEPVPEGFAVLTSSAATEDSQESIALRSSFFTYYLNSGLIGAADQNRDGAVTLSEVFGFTSSQTRAATAATPIGAQNPTYQYQLGGTRDLVLTRPGRRDIRRGTLRFAQAGRYVVQRWEPGGLTPPIAEVAAPESGVQIALPPGKYRVTLRGDRTISERDCAVTGGETTSVESAQMAAIEAGRLVRKGGPRRSANGFAVVGGWHSDTLGGARRGLWLGDGASLILAARHDRRRFSLELRVGLEQGAMTTNAGLKADNRTLSPSLAVLYPLDIRTVTLSVGLRGGVAFVRQEFSATDANPMLAVVPRDPTLSTSRWATGLEAGLLGQLDVPIGRHAFLRIETGLDGRAFAGTTSSYGTDHARGVQVHVVGGAGAAF
jgi:uncharacterized caspase-like protein